VDLTPWADRLPCPGRFACPHRYTTAVWPATGGEWPARIAFTGPAPDTSRRQAASSRSV